MENSAAILRSQKINFERIEAVNGYDLNPDDVERVYDSAANARLARHPLVPPEIGCYLSHLSAWERIACGESDGGFVFEDDFEAGRDLALVLSVLSEDRRDWDMVKLFSFGASPRVVASRPLGTDHQIVVPFRVPTCMIGYALTKAAAARLARRATPFFRPVDEDQKFFWETGLRVALVLPTPLRVGDQRAVTGTIGAARRAAKADGIAFSRFARGVALQLRYLTLLHWHRARRTGL